MPPKVYLDQCTVSNLVRQQMPWHETRAGNALKAGLDRGLIEVWVSPMHVMETFLCAEFDANHRIVDTPQLDLRQSIASVLLHLAEARRMSQSYEFILVEDFMKMLDVLAPGSVNGWGPFNWLQKHNQQIYLGLLGMLASYRTLDRPDAISDLLRSKITSRLLHSRFARSPRDFMDDVVVAAREYRVTREDIWAEFDQRPLSDLTREIEENEAVAVRLDGGTAQRLQRDRDLIARSYGAVEIGECMSSVFSDPLFLMLTFNLAVIRDRWREILGRDVAPPTFLQEAADESLAADHDLLIRTLELLFRAVASERLLLPRLVHKVILGELDLAARAGEVPSGGLGFDSEHAAMLSRVDALVTSDGRFATLARRASVELADAGHRVQVLSGTDELVHFLERLSGGAVI